MSENHAVTVVTPTLREAPNLGRLAERIQKTLCGGRWELLVVDDDSDDGTDRVARELGERLPVRLHTRRHGAADPAMAVLDGIARANHDRIVVMAADLGHQPEDMPKLLAALDRGFDMVVGSRYLPSGGTSPSTETTARIGYWLKTEMALPLAAGCTDPLSGFFAVNRRKLPELTDLTPDGGSIALELIARGRLKTVDVAIRTDSRHRGERKRRWPRFRGYLPQLARLYYDAARRPAPRQAR